MRLRKPGMGAITVWKNSPKKKCAGGSHEWIELRNTTRAVIDFSNWELTRFDDNTDTEVLMDRSYGTWNARR